MSDHMKRKAAQHQLPATKPSTIETTCLVAAIRTGIGSQPGESLGGDRNYDHRLGAGPRRRIKATILQLLCCYLR
jgi:hypothetical protein